MTKAPRLTTLRPRVAMASQRLMPRPKTAAAIYSSPEWRSLIAAIIRERGRRCEDPACQSLNHGAGRKVYGDHVVELQDGGALLDPANVMLRCAPCHGRKTTEEKKQKDGNAMVRVCGFVPLKATSSLGPRSTPFPHFEVLGDVFSNGILKGYNLEF